ncbi:hypothetical protein Ocin01_12635, partial [Orchesella cincta]
YTYSLGRIYYRIMYDFSLADDPYSAGIHVVPTKWLKPRLKSICVGFGAADVTLVLLSMLGWYFFFDIGYRAQTGYNIIVVRNPLLANSTVLRKDKYERSTDELRVERTKRACGILETDTNDPNAAIIDRNFAGPAALIGSAMGGYCVLGALLAALSTLDHSAARKVICQVCLVGEGIFTIFLVLALSLLSSTEDLCPTEYYFESFQPMAYMMSLAIISICAYKAYELTIIVFYLTEQSQVVEKEDAEIHELHEHENFRRHSLTSSQQQQSQPQPPPSSYTSGPDSSRPPTAMTITSQAESDKPRGEEPQPQPSPPYRENFKKYVEGVLCAIVKNGNQYGQVVTKARFLLQLTPASSSFIISNVMQEKSKNAARAIAPMKPIKLPSCGRFGKLDITTVVRWAAVVDVFRVLILLGPMIAMFHACTNLHPIFPPNRGANFKDNVAYIMYAANRTNLTRVETNMAHRVELKCKKEYGDNLPTVWAQAQPTLYKALYLGGIAMILPSVSALIFIMVQKKDLYASIAALIHFSFEIISICLGIFAAWFISDRRLCFLGAFNKYYSIPAIFWTSNYTYDSIANPRLGYRTPKPEDELQAYLTELSNMGIAPKFKVDIRKDAVPREWGYINSLIKKILHDVRIQMAELHRDDPLVNDLLRSGKLHKKSRRRSSAGPSVLKIAKMIQKEHSEYKLLSHHQHHGNETDNTGGKWRLFYQNLI